MATKAAIEVGTHPPAKSTAVTERKPRKAPAKAVRSMALVAPDGGMEGLLALAIREKTPVEALERLVALKERVDAQEAAKQFFAAKASFQQACPRIKKAGIVDYVPTSGAGRVKFNYALLDDIDAVVRPLCNERGLSYAWNSKPEGSLVTTEFVLRHVGGHAESSFFSCPTTSKAGMSDQQKYGAAVKYAMRWSLIQGLGLITTDDDDDAAEVDPTPISADQLVAIEDLLEARKATWKNPAKRVADFLVFMGAPALAEIRASDYQKAVETLKPKADA